MSEINHGLERVVSSMEQSKPASDPLIFISRGEALILQLGELQQRGQLTAGQPEGLLERAFFPGRNDPQIRQEWYQHLLGAHGRGDRAGVAVGMIEARHLGFLTDSQITAEVNLVMELLAEKYGLPTSPTVLDVSTPPEAPDVDKPPKKTGWLFKRNENIELRVEELRRDREASAAKERAKELIAARAPEPASHLESGNVDLEPPTPPEPELPEPAHPELPDSKVILTPQPPPIPNLSAEEIRLEDLDPAIIASIIGAVPSQPKVAPAASDSVPEGSAPDVEQIQRAGEEKITEAANQPPKKGGFRFRLPTFLGGKPSPKHLAAQEEEKLAKTEARTVELMDKEGLSEDEAIERAATEAKQK